MKRSCVVVGDAAHRPYRFPLSSDLRTCALILLLVWLYYAGSILAGDGDSDFFPPGTDTAVQVADAPYSDLFTELILYRPLTLVFYDLTAGELLAGIDIDKQMPVASAVKGPILLYFLTHVDRAVWGRVPVAYWHTDHPDAVPFHYRRAWHTHRAILRDLYRMIVFSDNASTGNVLFYAYTADGDASDLNPVQAFNRWSQTVIGISAESGMREWDEGATDNPAWIEPVYNTRLTTIAGVPRFYNNMFSALDLARYYHWLYTQADKAVYDCAVALMSVIDGYPGFLEGTALTLEGVPVSKDGFVGPGDRNNAPDEYLTADAGLILLEDRALMVVTMGVNGGDRLDEVYAEIERIARRDRGDLFWPDSMDFPEWMRSELGPLGVNTLSVEGINFVLIYLTELGMRPERGRVFTGDRVRFDEALAVWLAIFPGDVIPATRDAAQARVMAARYGGSGERLTDIAVDLGLVDVGDE